jgi:hypothetical protein
MIRFDKVDICRYIMEKCRTAKVTENTSNATVRFDKSFRRRESPAQERPQ